MTVYAICFDFPEMPGEPCFAAILDEGLGFTRTLNGATTFRDEAAAERTLANGYGDETRACGVVVEVPGR